MTEIINNNVGSVCSRSARCRSGVALLVVLFIVMTISVLSLGFLAGSDIELAVGQNMATVTQLGHLAESGLEHARGLIVSPQDISSEYWTGASGQQLAAGNDYYDVRVVRDDSDPTDRCNYIIDCDAYRIVNGEQRGLAGVTASLRLDPCIALWTGANSRFWPGVTVYGDVYCGGNVVNVGSIGGDVFAAGSYDGNVVQGSVEESTVEIPVAWPNITVADFVFATGVTYYGSSTAIEGNVTIEGMLLVDGSLTVRSANNVIVADKNLPALYVVGDLIVEQGGELNVEGLALVYGRVLVNGDASVSVTGGLFAQDTLLETAEDSVVSGQNCILYNGPTWRTGSGQTGGALEFDGVDDYAQTDDSAGGLQLTADYTISVWVNANAVQNDWAGLLSKCNSGGSIDHWTVQFDNGNPQRLQVSHPTGSWYTNIMLSELSGSWHHVAVVRSGDQMTAYLDGVPRNSGLLAIAPGSGAGHLNFGVDKAGAGGSKYDGLMDEVRIYSTALDPNDVYPPRDGVAGLIGHWRLDEEGADVELTAAPCKTALRVWYAGTVQEQWQQVGGSFFGSVSRR